MKLNTTSQLNDNEIRATGYLPITIKHKLQSKHGQKYGNEVLELEFRYYI